MSSMTVTWVMRNPCKTVSALWVAAGVIARGIDRPLQFWAFFDKHVGVFHHAKEQIVFPAFFLGRAGKHRVVFFLRRATTIGEIHDK